MLVCVCMLVMGNRMRGVCTGEEYREMGTRLDEESVLLTCCAISTHRGLSLTGDPVSPSCGLTRASASSAAENLRGPSLTEPVPSMMTVPGLQGDGGGGKKAGGRGREGRDRTTTIMITLCFITFIAYFSMHYVQYIQYMHQYD